MPPHHGQSTQRFPRAGLFQETGLGGATPRGLSAVSGGARIPAVRHGTGAKPKRCRGRRRRPCHTQSTWPTRDMECARQRAASAARRRRFHCRRYDGGRFLKQPCLLTTPSSAAATPAKLPKPGLKKRPVQYGSPSGALKARCHTSPGQRPGNRMVMGLSPVGASYLPYLRTEVAWSAPSGLNLRCGRVPRALPWAPGTPLWG